MLLVRDTALLSSIIHVEVTGMIFDEIETAYVKIIPISFVAEHDEGVFRLRK